MRRARRSRAGALERAIARALAFLRAHREESVQAGLAIFLPASGTPTRERFLLNLAAAQNPDGHWHHSLSETAWNLRLLHDLGEHRTPGVYRAIEWIFSRQGQPGAFALGCSAARHRERLCQHFFGPCFSPGDVQIGSVRFPNGAEITSNAGARPADGAPARAGEATLAQSGAGFLISNVALEALLRWGYDRDPRLESYLDSLRNFPRMLSRYKDRFTPAVVVSVLAILLRDRHPRSKKQAGNMLRLLARRQKRDGSWPHLDRFFVLDVIGASRNPHALRMLARSRRWLLAHMRRGATSPPWGTGALSTGNALRALLATSHGFRSKDELLLRDEFSKLAARCGA